MRQHAALTILQLDRNSDTYGPYESWWFFCLMLPCSLLVTEVCRWILHVQLLFLLCNTQKKRKTCGFGGVAGLLLQIKKKQQHTFSSYLKTAKQDDKNHMLVEKFWWKGTSGGPSVQIAVQNRANSKARSCCSEPCPSDFWISSRTEIWTALWQICSSAEAPSRGSIFLLCLIRVYLAAACSHWLPLCPSKT